MIVCLGAKDSQEPGNKLIDDITQKLFQLRNCHWQDTAGAAAGYTSQQGLVKSVKSKVLNHNWPTNYMCDVCIIRPVKGLYKYSECHMLVREATFKKMLLKYEFLF